MITNRTELVFILDRSGSMSGLESDTIGGFNAMLKNQIEQEGECIISTILFDNHYEVLHNRLELNAVSAISDKEYFVRGSTALLDAIGRAISQTIDNQNQTKVKYRADKVLFVIITDGMENASSEYDYSKVKAMIQQQKEEFGWEFIFLGANIDAVNVASKFGVHRGRAQSYHNDSKGVELNYEVISKTVGIFRKSAKGVKINDQWSKEISEDYKNRGGKH